MKNIIQLFLITILFASCGSKTTATEEQHTTEKESNVITLTDAQMNHANIVAGKIEQKEITSILKVNGKIDVPPQNMVSISLPLGGYLKSTILLQLNELVVFHHRNDFMFIDMHPGQQVC